jgi:hypothetical protein
MCNYKILMLLMDSKCHCKMWSICYSAETKWKPEERFVSTTTTGKQGEEHEQHKL